MASAARALGGLTRSDPIPGSGAQLVSYMGGRDAAVRALSGMPGSPRRADFASPEQFDAARRTWRSASRRVQRWTAPEGRERRGQAAAPKLSTTDRRRAQAANRRRKAQTTRARGVRASLTARIRVNSPGDRRDKVRTITAGGVGVRIRAGYVQRAEDALRAGDTEAAERHLTRGFLAGAGMPSTTTVTGASWTLWPDADSDDDARWDPYDEGDDQADEDAGEL